MNNLNHLFLKIQQNVFSSIHRKNIDIFDYFMLSIIPEDLLPEIYQFMSYHSKISLCRSNYIQYYPQRIKNLRNSGILHSFIKFIIKNNNDCALKSILSNETNNLKKIKKFHFKLKGIEYVVKNYLTFMFILSKHFKSSKCKDIIQKLDKNIYKNIKFKNIRWTN